MLRLIALARMDFPEPVGPVMAQGLVGGDVPGGVGEELPVAGLEGDVLQGD